jgi:large subunit ribosomal protein L1
VHAVVGKLSFEGDKLAENVRAFIDCIDGMKPATTKGQYIKTITISATMSPGIQIAA